MFKGIRLYRTALIIVALSGMSLGLAVSFIVQAEVLGTLLMVLVFGIWTVWLSSLSRVVTTMVTGVAITGLLLSIYDRIPITPDMTTSQESLVLLVSFVLLSLCIFSKRRISTSIAQAVGDLASSLTALLLIARWPMRSPAEYLSFLSYEDNAAWIRSASATIGIHHGAFSDSGYGAAPSLDQIIAGIRVLGTLLGGLSEAPSSSYQVVGMTYAFLNLLGMIAVGLAVSTKLSHRGGTYSWASNWLPTVATTVLVYVCLQVPATTGHLTFVGALAFLWVLSIAHVGKHVSDDRDWRSLWTRAAIAIGVVGMWWPLAIVVMPYLLLLVSESQLAIRLRNFAFQDLRKAVLVILGLILASTLAASTLGSGFLMLSIREFLEAPGGVQPVPGNALLLCLLVVGVFATASWHTREISLVNLVRDESYVLLTLVFSVGLLVVVSYFVGPTFSPNYASNKLTLLAVSFSVPLTVSALLILSRELVNIRWSMFATCIIFLVGSQSFGWNANNPRVLTKPVWSDKLLEIADQNPRSMIFCTTGDPSRNFDAYLCSRHALELQYQRHSIGNAWRNLQVNPVQDPANEDRSTLIREGITDLLDEGVPLIFLSLEAKFEIAQEDAWWMDDIPIDRITIVGLS